MKFEHRIRKELIKARRMTSETLVKLKTESTYSLYGQATSCHHIMPAIHVKSKFDSEFRRFSIPIDMENIMTYEGFRGHVERMHSLLGIPFTLCYTSIAGDLLPITNDENFRKSFESSQPCLRLLVQRKGESWEEKYGYGTDSTERKRKGLSILMPVSNKPHRRNYNISNPEDFRQVSAIIDVDIVPDTHRRVRLCKHGTDRPLGFYIRTGTAVRLTPQGAVKMDGIFINRLVEGGLAESTGLLGSNDEIIEVNGIDVQGKSIDQVTDMMVANAQNLIITIKPANQQNTLHNRQNSRQQFQEFQNYQFQNDLQRLSVTSNGSHTGLQLQKPHFSRQSPENESFDSDEDEVIDHTSANSYHYR